MSHVAESPTPAVTGHSGVVVARLPIVDHERVVIGFELVHRAGSGTEAVDTDAIVTMSGLLGTVDFEIASVVGDRLLFCTVDRAFLLSDSPLMLPPQKTVLGVRLDDVTDDLVAAVGAHRSEGFAICLDRPALGPGLDALLPYADLVKVDLRTSTPGEVMDVVDRCRQYSSAELLAVPCDTEAELRWAVAVGFDLFTGRAVQVPEIPIGSTIAPSALSQVQLGVELLSRDLDLDRIETILRGDPALVVQLLNMASMGAGGGLRRQVRSLREALVVMGTVRLRQWAALVILGRHGRVQTDALVTALVRARMCELLAPREGIDGAFAFTAGLLSSLDLVLGVELAEIDRQIQVDDELRAGAFHREGFLGDLINRVEAYQDAVAWGHQPPAQPDDIMAIGAMAFSWATSYVSALDSSAGADA